MNTTALKIVLDTNILIAIIGRRSPFRRIFDCHYRRQNNHLRFKRNFARISGNSDKENERRSCRKRRQFHHDKSFYGENRDFFFNFGLIEDDADDDQFVDCAIAANAICLISNDNHFQVLKTIDFPKIIVFHLAEFEAKYKARLTEIRE